MLASVFPVDVLCGTVTRTLLLVPNTPVSEVTELLRVACGIADDDGLVGFVYVEEGEETLLPLDQLVADPARFSSSADEVQLVLASDLASIDLEQTNDKEQRESAYFNGGLEVNDVEDEDEDEDEDEEQQQKQHDDDVAREINEVDELADRTGFNLLGPSTLFNLFRESSGERGYLSRTEFVATFSALALELGASASTEEALLVFEELFQLFDKDGNGVVDFREFAAGVQLLADGTREEKMAIAFAAYDADGDGFIDREEMVTYFTSFFSVLATFSPSVAAKLQGIELADIAEATTDQCFVEADANQDGVISFEEFKDWYNATAQGGDANTSLIPLE